jgi:hypothetical protein
MIFQMCRQSQTEVLLSLMAARPISDPSITTEGCELEY